MGRPRTVPADAVSWVAGGPVTPTRDVHGRPLIRLQTLGASVVQCGEMRICPSAGVLFALLLRLTHSPAMRAPRDVLLELLWPGQDDARRRASLRQALYKLRGSDVRVGLDGDVVQLDPTQIVPTFAATRTMEWFERDVLAGGEPFGPFLPGYLPPTATLEEWVGVEREAVHADVRRVLVDQLRGQRERADWGRAEALARWLLKFDPLHEDATRTVAECAMLAGAKAEAIAIVDRYLAELGPNAGDIRLPALQMRRRFVDATRGRPSFARTERHFVGREDDLRELTLAMRRARWRDSSALLLHGPSGIGKTRFTLEVGKIAAIEGVTEVRASCCESDGMRILSVLLDVLPELMAQPGALGCEPESLETLRRLVPESAMRPRASAAIDGSANNDEKIAAATAQGVPASSLTCCARGDSTSSVITREPLPMPASVRRALVDLLAAVSDERPVMLIVDNAHWLDSSSWDVLTDVMDRMSEMRVVLLLTSRVPHACAVRPERVSTSLVVRELPPLNAESSALLARLIGEDLSASVCDDICDWFVGSCEGSPLFLRSLVNHWIETGEAGGVPPTLQQVIELRISKLSPDALKTLQAIALLGQHATVARTQRVLDSSTLESLEWLEELSRAGVFRETSKSTLVCHELLRRAAIDSIGRPARQILHLRIADVLAADHRDDDGALALAVIEHLRDCDELARIAEFARGRSEALLDGGYPTRALAVCEAAKAAVPKLIDDVLLRRIELEALYFAGRYSRLIERLSSEEIDFLVDDTWDAVHPEAVLRFVESARHSISFGDFENQCARATILAETESVPEQLRVKAATTAIRVASHGLTDSLPKRAYNAALPMCDRLPNSQIERALLDMYFHASFGNPNVALSAARSLLIHAVPNQNPRDRLFFTSDIACALRMCGAIDEARKLFEGVFADDASAQFAFVTGLAAWYLALIAIEDGDHALAKDWLTRGASVIGFEQEILLRYLVAELRARIAIETGDLESAVSNQGEATRLFPTAIRPKNLAYRIALELGIAMLKGNTSEVHRLLPEAERCFASLKQSLGQDFLATQLAYALRLTGETDKAAEIISDYVHNARRDRSKLPKHLELAMSQ